MKLFRCVARSSTAQCGGCAFGLWAVYQVMGERDYGQVRSGTANRGQGSQDNVSVRYLLSQPLEPVKLV
jgi:hypothetical protein